MPSSQQLAAMPWQHDSRSECFEGGGGSVSLHVPVRILPMMSCAVTIGP